MVQKLPAAAAVVVGSINLRKASVQIGTESNLLKPFCFSR